MANTVYFDFYKVRREADLLKSQGYSDNEIEIKQVGNQMCALPLRVVENPDMPKDRILVLPERKEDETDAEFFARCILIKNVGKNEP